MKLRIIPTLVIAMLLCTHVTAQQKAAWELTTSERLAARLDPKLMAMRSLAEDATGAGAPPRARFVIDGRRNPELFLPSELMSLFLSDVMTGDAKHRRDDRHSYQAWMEHLGWNEEAFWGDVDAAAVEYLRLVNARGGQDRPAAASRRICGERVTALETMRRKYERFDEFLYGAFAPRQTVASDQVTPADRLLWIEGGCR